MLSAKQGNYVYTV